MTTKTKAQQAEHYVNNKEFTAAVIEYNQQVKEALDRDEDKPMMSEYIGECIYKIATRLSTRPNFINYTYRDEMICDAIENCLQYINNFNPEKSNNAFAYITQICYYAFLRRIQKDDPSFVNTNIEWMQDNMNPVDYKPRKDKKPTTTKKKTKNNLDKFTK
jgi:hypothetical protein